jgi:hypothetical protein
MASPKRMGAALTYARRYALFTLVGIAGEDDLDAPDLCDVDTSSPGPASGNGKAGSGLHGSPAPPRSAGNAHFRGATRGNVPVLPPDQSAALRDRLLGEIGRLAEADAAATWARGMIAAKNSLTGADARTVEDAFERQVVGLGELVEPEELTIPAIEPFDSGLPAPTTTVDVAVPEVHEPSAVDKSALAIAEPRRYRNKEHLRFVATKACVVCGRKPSDPHHLRFIQPRALGRKVSDEFVVPLCRGHHRAVHRSGNERAWWTTVGVDPIKIARRLWKHTRRVNRLPTLRGSIFEADPPP